MEKSAIFSEDRVYRWVLSRVWNIKLPHLNVIGLNPSTADETVDDPTIRRCLDFACRWGFGGLYMTNLFAFRSPSPKIMKGFCAPTGNENDRWLNQIARDPRTGLVLAAWGKDGKHRRRDEIVRGVLDGVDLRCIKQNQDGTPVHPLYQPKDSQPIIFEVSK